MRAMFTGFLLCLLVASCARDGGDKRAGGDGYVDPSKFIKLEDREREDIAKLVADAKARLMMPYILAGEDVGSLVLGVEIALRQNSDKALLRELKRIGPDCGYLYYFLQRSPMEKERVASIAFIEANKPVKSELPAFKVEERMEAEGKL